MGVLSVEFRYLGFFNRGQIEWKSLISFLLFLDKEVFERKYLFFLYDNCFFFQVIVDEYLVIVVYCFFKRLEFGNVGIIINDYYE